MIEMKKNEKYDKEKEEGKTKYSDSTTIDEGKGVVDVAMMLIYMNLMHPLVQVTGFMIF